MIRRYIPDTLTLFNALCGAIATAFAFQGCYPQAAGFIILAAFMLIPGLDTVLDKIILVPAQWIVNGLYSLFGLT